MYLNIGESGRVISKYHGTCPSQTWQEPAFVFRINRCSHYASYINKDFLQQDFILYVIYIGFRFIQVFDKINFYCNTFISVNYNKISSFNFAICRNQLTSTQTQSYLNSTDKARSGTISSITLWKNSTSGWNRIVKIWLEHFQS